MLVTISGLIGRALQPLPSADGTPPIFEAALAVESSGSKNWFALTFADAALVRVAQSVRQGDTIAVTGELTFAPMPDGAHRPFKPVVTVSDLQLCHLPVASLDPTKA